MVLLAYLWLPRGFCCFTLMHQGLLLQQCLFWGYVSLSFSACYMIPTSCTLFCYASCADESSLYSGDDKWRDFPELEAAVNVDWTRIFNRDGYLDEDQELSELPRFPLLSSKPIRASSRPAAPVVPPGPVPRPPGTASTKRGPEHSIESRWTKKAKASTGHQAFHGTPSDDMNRSDAVIPASPPVPKFEFSSSSIHRDILRRGSQYPRAPPDGAFGQASLNNVDDENQLSDVIDHQGTPDDALFGMDNPSGTTIEASQPVKSRPGPRRLSEIPRYSPREPLAPRTRPDDEHQLPAPTWTSVNKSNLIDLTGEDETRPAEQAQASNVWTRAQHQTLAANTSAHSQQSSYDLPSMIEYTTELMVNFRATCKKQPWFSNWHLKPALAEEYWERCIKQVTNGEYAPLPLIMCDSEISDLDSITLAQALSREEPGRYVHNHRLNSGRKGVGISQQLHVSHKCHNSPCRLPLHLMQDPALLTLKDREKCRTSVVTYLRRGLGFPLYCAGHGEHGSCIMGCLALDRVQQVTGQWMAANDITDLSAASMWKLGDMQSVDNGLVEAQLITYLAEQTPDGITLRPVAKHSLKTLCHAAWASDDEQIRNLMMQIRDRETITAEQRPASDDELLDQTMIRLQRDSIAQLDNTHPELMQHNREASTWENVDDGKGGLYCRLCFTRWNELSHNKWPKRHNTVPFTRLVVTYAFHIGCHTNYHAAVVCEELLNLIATSLLFRNSCRDHGGVSRFCDLESRLRRHELPHANDLRQYFHAKATKNKGKK